MAHQIVLGHPETSQCGFIHGCDQEVPDGTAVVPHGGKDDEGLRMVNSGQREQRLGSVGWRPSTGLQFARDDPRGLLAGHDESSPLGQSQWSRASEKPTLGAPPAEAQECLGFLLVLHSLGDRIEVQTVGKSC